MSADAPIGIVAGSGIEIEPLLDEVIRVRSFGQVSGLPPTDVQGHPGRIVEGVCAGVPVVLQCGRLHCYEGYGYGQVTSPLEVMRDLGVRSVLFTNAAGGLHAGLNPGDLMAVTDVLLWPYRGWTEHPETIGTDFVMDGCDARGRYFWVHGPCYETPAEVAALRALQGDAVGMSTAPELARCRELGMRSAAISCITNQCATRETLTHRHVVEKARAISGKLRAVIRRELPKLHDGARV